MLNQYLQIYAGKSYLISKVGDLVSEFSFIMANVYYKRNLNVNKLEIGHTFKTNYG